MRLIDADALLQALHNNIIDDRDDALWVVTNAPTVKQGEPFGYFKAEPFGWTDCAETDEGAIALYENLPAQYEAERKKALEHQSASEIAELKEKLQTELKRVSSYKTLVASLEGQVSHYSRKDYSLSKARLDGLEQSLASEQEMNEVLTNENTELQAHINVLREALKFYDDIDFPYTIAIDALSATPAQTSKGERNAI